MRSGQLSSGFPEQSRKIKKCPPQCEQHLFVLTELKSRESTSLQFCPRYHHGNTIPQQTYPIFNRDGLYFTCGFAIGVDKADLQRSRDLIREEFNKDRNKKSSWTPDQTVPDRRRSRCDVCRNRFEKYEDHMRTEEHITNLQNNAYHKHILELTRELKLKSQSAELWETATQHSRRNKEVVEFVISSDQQTSTKKIAEKLSSPKAKEEAESSSSNSDRKMLKKNKKNNRRERLPSSSDEDSNSSEVKRRAALKRSKFKKVEPLPAANRSEVFLIEKPQINAPNLEKQTESILNRLTKDIRHKNANQKPSDKKPEYVRQPAYESNSVKRHLHLLESKTTTFPLAAPKPAPPPPSALQRQTQFLRHKAIIDLERDVVVMERDSKKRSSRDMEILEHIERNSMQMMPQPMKPESMKPQIILNMTDIEMYLQSLVKK